uniref:Uncharacterized protein n=1 Tax=Pararge aegeria TaxID=116150 RepID=S4PT36_9NEOP
MCIPKNIFRKPIAFTNTWLAYIFIFRNVFRDDNATYAINSPLRRPYANDYDRRYSKQTCLYILNKLLCLPVQFVQVEFFITVQFSCMNKET